jgi:hypothetical protein
MSSLSPSSRREFQELVDGAIQKVMEDHPNARIGTIVNKVADLIQEECDELLIRDEDDQAIAKIIEAALDKFLADRDLGGVDETTSDRIVRQLWERMDDVAKDWCLDAYTCLEAVIDDLIEETKWRARNDMDAILAGEYLDEDDEEDCDA